MGQPSQNGPLTVQHFRSLLLDIMKAPFVVPTSIVTPSWLIAVALRLLDYALSYYVLHACDGRFVLVRAIAAEKQTSTDFALCHVWTAPRWQGLSSGLQHWSVQPRGA
jgi:hypothetical protein